MIRTTLTLILKDKGRVEYTTYTENDYSTLSETMFNFKYNKSDEFVEILHTDRNSGRTKESYVRNSEILCAEILQQDCDETSRDMLVELLENQVNMLSSQMRTGRWDFEQQLYKYINMGWLGRFWRLITFQKSMSFEGFMETFSKIYKSNNITHK